MHRCHVYLVPGFFGFTSLASLNYFYRVSDVLGEALETRGVDATIIECRTKPTGSIRHRADRLIEEVIASGGLDADEIHFVGHSTGGLDVRLLVTPGVRLRETKVELLLGEKVRSVISLATPHFGTPLANFFTTMQGRQLLEIITVLATTTPGRRAIFWSAQLLQFVATLDDKLGRTDTLLDRFANTILGEITLDEDDPLWDFIKEVSTDQGAIIQLTPEGMDLFNAAVTDRAGVDYRCLVTAAPAPFAHRLSTLLSPQAVARAGVFGLLYKLAAREHRSYPYPSPAHELRDVIQELLPFELTTATNDAIVPTLSQLYGEPIGAVVGDHLDVVGQFCQSGGNSLSDWLPSGSGFNEARFQKVWADIADAIAAASDVAVETGGPGQTTKEVAPPV